MPLTLLDVYLVTAAGAGQVAVNGLGLVVDQRGLTVLSPRGTAAALLPWEELSDVRTLGPAVAPGGETAVLLEAATAERTHRFLVPTEDPGALEAVIASVTGIAAAPDADRPGRDR